MSSILKVDTIQNTGGTTGLTIDSSGRLVFLNPIIFYARKTDASNYTTVGTIVWNVSLQIRF